MRFSLVMWNAVFWRTLWNVADMGLKRATRVWSLHVFEKSNPCYMSLKTATCVTCLWKQQPVLHVFENSNPCMEFTCLWKEQPVYGVYMSMKRATHVWSLHVSEKTNLCMEFTCVWKQQPLLHVFEKSNPWMEFTCVWKDQPMYGVYTCLKRATHAWSLHVVWKEQPMHGVYMWSEKSNPCMEFTCGLKRATHAWSLQWSPGERLTFKSESSWHPISRTGLFINILKKWKCS